MTLRLAAIAATLALVVIWGALMSRFGSGDVYAVMGPYAASVIATAPLLAKLQGSAVAHGKWLAVTPRAVFVGVATGVAMTLATYPMFRFAAELVPGLDVTVESLYAAARARDLSHALAWTALIIVAEEVLWRGLVLDVLDERVPRSLASALSIASYALAQLGSGSLIVLLLALVCGTIWTVQRRVTGSIVAPLITHLIWSPAVILLWPVT
jgi:membrane protease YdiL (CAAX protease family)